MSNLEDLRTSINELASLSSCITLGFDFRSQIRTSIIILNISDLCVLISKILNR